MMHNENAMKLYTKQGFKIEGTKQHSIKIDNELIDEYYMAKIIWMTKDAGLLYRRPESFVIHMFQKGVTMTEIADLIEKMSRMD